jgi:hypothetical protein
MTLVAYDLGSVDQAVSICCLPFMIYFFVLVLSSSYTVITDVKAIGNMFFNSIVGFRKKECATVSGMNVSI